MALDSAGHSSPHGAHGSVVVVTPGPQDGTPMVVVVFVLVGHAVIGPPTPPAIFPTHASNAPEFVTRYAPGRPRSVELVESAT